MKLQTGISSKDLSALKEICELEKYKEAKQSGDIKDLYSETEETNEFNDGKAEKLTKKCSISSCLNWENCCLKWENCCLKPDNCCIVKVVKKITS